MGEIAKIILTPLRKIDGPSGSVLHALKKSESSFEAFGEAYFSTVNQGEIKGWKCHKQMIANLIVPIGKVKFVILERGIHASDSGFREIILSPENYCRLTIPPGNWFAFQGIDTGTNLILNISSIEHDPEECEQLSLINSIIPPYNW